MRAPDAIGVPATRRDMKVDGACAATTVDVLDIVVAAGDTTNPSAVAASVSNAATATDFMV